MRDLGFEDCHIATRDLPFNFLSMLQFLHALRLLISPRSTSPRVCLLEAEKSGRDFKNEAHQRNLKDCMTELVEALPDQWSLHD